MKNTVLPYIFKAFICPLVLLTSCSVEETGPSESALGNEVKVNVSASEIPAATKTTFDGETLVWSGNETMGILLADENSTSLAKTSSSVLTIDPATCTFSGVVNLGDFEDSDIRAVTVPANSEAWVCYDADKKNFSTRIPLAENQLQTKDGVMNGDNFPLSAMITEEVLAAGRQDDGSYEFQGIKLQWECAAIRFNIYGMHPNMKTDESFVSVSVTFNDSQKYNVSLVEKVYMFGKNKSSGLKVFMAIPSDVKTIEKVSVRTSRAVYTLESDGKPLMTMSGDDLSGNVYQFGLSLSKFTRDDSTGTTPELSTAYGKVTYEDGTPAQGIAMSDGFNVALTDNNGEYTLQTCSDTYYIYYSIPADCEVQVNEYGQPAFYTRYSKSKSRYDFKLKRRAGGKEDRFTLFCLADPQCKEKDLVRFANESVTEIKAHSMTFDVPCYGVTLGDVVYSEGDRNNVPQMDDMRDRMHKDLIGMPVFQVMGNHDYTYFKSTSPINPDKTSSTFNLKAQRAFEEVFGPIDYSWNRGDVHFVCMRDILWLDNTDAKSYEAMFTDQQCEWLAQDLALVPKDKMVILCVHIPFAGVKLTDKSNNVQRVVDMLNQFKEAHIMSGHTHYMRNEPTRTGGIYEHVHAAVSGCWWYSRVNGDGSPNGYGVYEIDGNTITNWYYKGVNDGMNSRDYQLRLYRGNIVTGGEKEKFAVPYKDNVLLANVFNADVDWKIKVYENDVYSGDMTLIPHVAKANDTPVFVDADTPSVPSANTSRDWWAIGYHVGVIGRGHVGGNRSSYLTGCYHMYKYTLKDKNARIRVEATDRFGRTYTQTEITGDFDYSLMGE